jgi:hypothetical protein
MSRASKASNAWLDAVRFSNGPISRRVVLLSSSAQQPLAKP